MSFSTKWLIIESSATIEMICETRQLDTDVSWYLETEEIQDGGRFSIKQYGYSHRLLIRDVFTTDERQVTVLAGSDTIAVPISFNRE